MKRVLFSTLCATLLVSAGYYFYFSLPDVSVLKQKNPNSTALMDLRDQEYKKQNSRGRRQQIWVSYGAISEHIKKAVLISEDAGFYSHKGVDVTELKAAFKKDLETLSFSRGGSTITMQLAKNLYLSPSKNPLRKLKEIIIAHQLENCPVEAAHFRGLLERRRIGPQYLWRRSGGATLLRQIRRFRRSGRSRDLGRPAAEPAQLQGARPSRPAQHHIEPPRQCRLPEPERKSQRPTARASQEG